MQQAKNLLRQQIKSSLLSLSPEEKRLASAHICEQLNLWLSQHPHCQTIATFAHLNNEPDLSSLHQSHPNIRWCYPLSDHLGNMHFHQIHSLAELECGLYGIRQPVLNKHPFVPTQEIDLFLCPALGYTRQGARLGKGGGYYDRLLSERSRSSTMLGIAFEVQIVDFIPTEDHDIHVHQLIYA